MEWSGVYERARVAGSRCLGRGWIRCPCRSWGCCPCRGGTSVPPAVAVSLPSPFRRGAGDRRAVDGVRPPGRCRCRGGGHYRRPSATRDGTTGLVLPRTASGKPLPSGRGRRLRSRRRGRSPSFACKATSLYNYKPTKNPIFARFPQVFRVIHKNRQKRATILPKWGVKE